MVNSPGSVSCADQENVQSHLYGILQWQSCCRMDFVCSLPVAGDWTGRTSGWNFLYPWFISLHSFLGPCLCCLRYLNLFLTLDKEQIFLKRDLWLQLSFDSWEESNWHLRVVWNAAILSSAFVFNHQWEVCISYGWSFGLKWVVNRICSGSGCSV